jgi:uncharacterized ParB-like nuclease family protein
VNLKTQARSDVEGARRFALFGQLLSFLRGEENHLLPFEWVRHLHPRAERYGGTKAIPLEAIIGSVDRYSDFDQQFLPLETHLDERWINIRSAQLEGRELPPIEVYKVGEAYFVKDGNHRVSVARKNGQRYIDAQIIELEVRISPEAGDSLQDMILKGEYAAFLEETHLDVVRPDHLEIRFTALGRYDFLLEHIRTRQYFLGVNLGREVSWDEAVASWYDRLYLRVVSQIHKHHSLEKFPGRTEADLYLWIMTHRYFLTEQYGKDVGSEQATIDFVGKFAPKWYKRLGQRLRRFLPHLSARKPLDTLEEGRAR